MLDLTYDPRASGEITRYHTWSVLRQQSVGEHSWQILRVMLTVWPRAPRRLLVHAVTHDMPEMAGDISYPFKVLFPELRAAITKAENHVVHEQTKNGRPEEVVLSPYEKLVFKLCEWIEMWEYGLHEINLGNKYAEIICRRMMAEIGPALHKLETELHETQDARQHPGIPQAAHRYILQRMKMEETNG